jgi:hypothetical protein
MLKLHGRSISDYQINLIYCKQYNSEVFKDDLNIYLEAANLLIKLKNVKILEIL